MQDDIIQTLRQSEREFGCRVLFACESGSRAWGFPSPDSDYDIRFIYVHPSEWYLRLNESPDTIDAMLPGDLDLGGWELRKTLRLFAGCNLPLNEWLNSPLVYAAVPEFHQLLRQLIPRYFQPKRAGYHYLRMAQKTLEENPLRQGIRSKKLFYILRPLFACGWVAQRRSMPPTEFAALLEAGLAPDEVLDPIREIQGRKQSLAEAASVQVPPPLVQWIGDALAQAAEAVETLPTHGSRDMETLNGVMRRWVREAGVSAVGNTQPK